MQNNTLTEQEIADTMRDMVLQLLQLDMPREAITMDTNLLEIGLDSMSVVGLLTDLEGRFNFTIDVEDLSAEMFNRFGNLVEFVKSKCDAAV
ncbi:MAG: acyl carrier protein [Pseudomonadota bacterium]|nr:acyl carrier protein [Pseudomonadota bacterium]